RPLWLAFAVMVPFAIIELTFLGANMLKVTDGGWVTILISTTVLVVMLTWRRGTSILFEKTRRSEVPLTLLTGNLAAKPPVLVDGTAIFLTGDRDSTPTALLHSLKHYHVLHKQNIILTVVTAERPRVPLSERAEIAVLNDLFTRLTLNYGY